MNPTKVQPELAKKMRRKGRGIGSIFQHYYPEGHWGYVVLLCAFLVQVRVARWFNMYTVRSFRSATIFCSHQGSH